jgi:hypothetical protein
VGVGLAAKASLQTGETPVLVRCYLQLSEMRPFEPDIFIARFGGASSPGRFLSVASA